MYSNRQRFELVKESFQEKPETVVNEIKKAEDSFTGEIHKLKDDVRTLMKRKEVKSIHLDDKLLLNSDSRYDSMKALIASNGECTVVGNTEKCKFNLKPLFNTNTPFPACKSINNLSTLNLASKERLPNGAPPMLSTVKFNLTSCQLHDQLHQDSGDRSLEDCENYALSCQGSINNVIYDSSEKRCRTSLGNNISYDPQFWNAQDKYSTTLIKTQTSCKTACAAEGKQFHTITTSSNGYSDACYCMTTTAFNTPVSTHPCGSAPYVKKFHHKDSVQSVKVQYTCGKDVATIKESDATPSINNSKFELTTTCNL